MNYTIHITYVCAVYPIYPLDILHLGGETALNIVTRQRRYDLMEFLHLYGVKINSADASGSTALHVAAMNNDVDGICRLLEWGADAPRRSRGRR